jgi:uncharacterized protein (TIGR01244 family)
MTGMVRAMPVRAFPVFVLAVFLVVVPGARIVPAQAVSVAPSAARAAPERAAPPAAAVAGVRNFTRVDPAIACGGALSPGAAAALREAGFASIVNLRSQSEPGANVADERKAAEAAGLRYIHIPFANATPDATKFDDFLKAYADPANRPMMLHCASGARASMFWAVERVMVDGRPVAAAMDELPDLSKNVGASLRAFVLDYFKSHGKTRP